MKEEQGKKLAPNDPDIPAEPDKPTALSDADLDSVAGGLWALAIGSPAVGRAIAEPVVGKKI